MDHGDRLNGPSGLIAARTKGTTVDVSPGLASSIDVPAKQIGNPMKRLILQALTASASLAAAIAPAPGIAAEIPPAARDAGFNKLVLDDDFDSLDLNPPGVTTHRWSNAIWFQKPSPLDSFSVSDGVLTIKTETATGRASQSAAITTYKKGSPDGRYLFGYFEARMRWPVNKWNWSTFFLHSELPTLQGATNNWTRYCEIDVAEAFSLNRYSSSVHDWYKSAVGKEYPEDPKAHQLFAKVSEWNVYGLLWTKSEMTFYLNGQEMVKIKTPPPCAEQKAFIILTASSHLGGPAESMDIDWIHIYQ